MKNSLEKHSSYCTDTAAVFPNETQHFMCFDAVLSQINLARGSLCISFARFSFYLEFRLVSNNDNKVLEMRSY